MCMYALRLTGDNSLAEDVVQESFSAVWERLEAGTEIEDLRAYIYRAVYNHSLAELRKQESMPERLDESDSAFREPVEEDIDTSERDARLWEAIGRLPERCREVFLLSKRDGFSNNQIAERLGLSVKTVENQMTRAYRQLRGELRRRSGNVFFLPFL